MSVGKNRRFLGNPKNKHPNFFYQNPHLCLLCVQFRTTCFGDLQTLERGCHRIHTRPGLAISLLSRWIHGVLILGDSVAPGANILRFGNNGLTVGAHIHNEEDTR